MCEGYKTRNVGRLDKLSIRFKKGQEIFYRVVQKTGPQCATGNPVPVPVDPVDFFRSGSGLVPAKY